MTKTRVASRNGAVFLRGFLMRPHEVGSIVPSSPFLERRLVQLADVAGAKRLVELGSGTGGTTRALLRAMAPDAELLSLELNPLFLPVLARIGDPRLHICQRNAMELPEILSDLRWESVDLVISGIPFSTMAREVGSCIVQRVFESLSAGGKFVAYQLRSRVDELSRPVFGPAEVELEVLNIPPMRLYRWDKAAVAAAEAR